MKFNVNNYVKIKLNERGKEILLKEWEAMPESYRSRYPFKSPKEDEEGWSKWQLWNVMETFGPHIFLGCVNPFDTEIEICE